MDGILGLFTPPRNGPPGYLAMGEYAGPGDGDVISLYSHYFTARSEILGSGDSWEVDRNTIARFKGFTAGFLNILDNTMEGDIYAINWDAAGNMILVIENNFEKCLQPRIFHFINYFLDAGK